MKWLSRRRPVRAVTSLTACAVLGAAMLSGCSSVGGDDPRPVVAASFGPLAWVAQEVAGNRYRVENLTSPGAEAHDLELGIRQVADVEKAALVLLLGGFQPAVDAAARNVAEGVVLDAADHVALQPPQTHEHADEHEHAEDHDHADEHADEHAEEVGGDHDGHDHGDLDPHFWQDPLRMADLGDAVAAELGRLDPGHADEFTARAASLRTDLVALDEQFATGLTGCERDTVVVSHEAFGYLTRYGLHFESINGLSPGAEPTPAGLARLQQLIRTDGITTVFSETRSTRKMAETLARDTGVDTAVLDPLEAVPTSGSENYVTTMQANLTALQQANGCR